MTQLVHYGVHHPAHVYYGLPRRARRVGLVRAPINPLDPTEAVDSASILPAVERLFSVEARRDYGSALLSLIFGNLALATAPPGGDRPSSGAPSARRDTSR